ncbi:MAG TPA: YraN family protein [Flavobacteriaceae bacterium]|nr:YraN family protein [Flavobacteriaceae bacterium]
MAKHNELGEIGEEMAVEYLSDKGYVILERNYRFDRAEVDIIAQDNEQIVIVEVKTRTSDFFGDPQEFVSPGKIKQLVKVADHYLISKEIDRETRFDIVAILVNKKEQSIEHFIDAFYHF